MKKSISLAVTLGVVGAYVLGAGVAQAGLPYGCDWFTCAAHAGNSCWAAGLETEDPDDGEPIYVDFVEDEYCSWGCDVGPAEGALDCSGF